MRHLIMVLPLLKSCFALHLIQSWYQNPEDPAKAKEACLNDPISFSYTTIVSSGLITDVSDHEICSDTVCQWSGTDSCYFWGIDNNGKILYQNFTYVMQDANDIRAWATRPFCFSAPHDTKRLNNGDCLMTVDDQEYGDSYTKVNIGRKSKSCVLVAETYKNEFCTIPSKAFPLRYELDINECEAGFFYATDPDWGVWAMMASKVNATVYQIQNYADPNCIFEDPDWPNPLYLKIGECSPDQDDDDDTPFKTWTKVVSLTCDKNYKNQKTGYEKIPKYTSFKRLVKTGIRKAKLKMINQ